MPILSRRRLHVYRTYFHTRCGLSANLGCRSETCCTRLAENTGRKNRQKFAIWAASHNFVRLYLCNWGTYRQSEKKLLNNNISPICSYNMVNFGPLAAEVVSLVWCTPANFNGFCILLWPPYVIGGPLYFCPGISVFFFYLLSSFFPRLISVAAGWMSTILWHMVTVWP